VVVGAIPAGERTVDGGGEGGERLAPGGREGPAGPWRHGAKASGTRGNIDHLVIAPAGVFVVDARARHLGMMVCRS
jgi:hypothetical protein